MSERSRVKKIGFHGGEENIENPFDHCRYEKDAYDLVGDDNNQFNGRAPSSLGSSPPKDFNVNHELQYLPISADDAFGEDINQQSSSLASSLSLDSDQDYTISPVLLTSNCRVIRCPVCEKPMRTFYCSKCIQKGHFVTLDKSVDELETRTYPILDELEIDEKKQVTDEQKIKEEDLQVRLRIIKGKIEALRSLRKSQEINLDETKRLLKETQNRIDIEKKSRQNKEAKIGLIKKYIAGRQGSVKKRLDATNELLENIRQYVNQRVYQLTTDIFPIEQINLLEQNSFVNMETSPLLTFSDGSHHQIEQQTAYSIVEPWLPCDGDYSAYSLWVNDNKDHIPASMSEMSDRNPAYRIRAALSFTVQLVNNLASHLDVILPARLDLDVFNRELLDDSHFCYNVAKLNSNVIHLCVSQGVDVSLLNSQRTLKNLMLMLNINISDIGRRPIIEIDNGEAATRIEEKLSSDLSLVQENFYDFSKLMDEEEVSDSEWEISDTIAPTDMQQANELSIQQNSYISRLPPLRLLASFWSSNGS